MAGKKNIWYGIGLDNKNLKKDAENSKRIIGGISKKAVKEGKTIDNTYQKLSRSIGAVFTIAAAGSFIKKMAMVRGEFQQLEVAFTTMLGSKAKADKLMADTIDFAARTPFDLQGVANGTKQLLAYGSEAGSVTGELEMLGNVAAGLSIPLGDLVYLYGTTRTQGRLFTMDLRQFMGRGIPLAEELAKQFGVAKDKVGDLVTAGKVGFKHVEIAMKSMTAEGGKFYNLMEEQSKTITGKISNLGDGISQMFNKIGKANQDTISGVIDNAGYLVDNYEKVGKIIAELIATYGVYKAALITFNAVQSLVNTAGVYDVATKKLQIKATLKAKFVQMQLNKTMLLNPYVLAAAAIATLTYAMYKYITRATNVEIATNRVNDILEKQKELIIKEKEAVKGYLKIIKDEVSTITQKQTALEALQKLQPSIFSNMDIKAIKTKNQNELDKAGNILIEKRNKLQLQKLINDNKNQIKTKESLLSKIGFSKGDSGTRKALNQSIDILKATNRSLGNELKELEKSKLRAEYNALSNSQKLSAKQNEINVLKKELLNPILNDLQKEIINNKIQDANVIKNELIKKIAKEVKVLNEKKNLIKEIRDLQKETASLRLKYNTGKGLSVEETKKLKENLKTVQQLQGELAKLSGVKTTTGGSAKFNIISTQEASKRQEEDIVYQSELKKLQIRKDGAEKTLALIKFENKRKLVVLNRQKADDFAKIEANSQADKKANPKTYDESFWIKKALLYREIWDKAILQQGKNNAQSVNDFTDNLLSNYLTYAEKVKQLTATAEGKIKIFTDKGTAEGNKGKYAENIKKVRQELQKLIIEAGKSSNNSVLGKLFGDNTYTTVQGLRDIVAESEKMYKTLEDGGASIQELHAVREQIDLLNKAIRGTETGFHLMGEGLKEVFSGNYKNGGNITTALGKVDAGFQKARKYIQFFSDSLGSLGESFDSQALKDVSATINNVMDVADSTLKGAKLGAELGGPIGAAVGAALGLATSLAKIFAAKHDKRLEEKIARLQEQVDTLKRAYDSLGNAIDKAYSSDASALIQQQDANLRRQKAILQEQIRAEQSKKKSDDAKIKAWQDAIYAIDQTLANTEARQIEAINGTSVQDAISQFADAYISAWSAGEDKAKSMKNVVKNMVKAAIAELVKSRLSGEVEAFMSYLATAMEDGILTVAEQGVLDNLQAAIDNKLAGLSDTLDSYMINSNENTRKAVNKGFASMSQDSADELNGRFATIQSHTYSITESLKTILITSAHQLRYLAGIEENTSSLYRLAKIESDIGSMKLGISEINDNGIKIKR